MAKALGVAGEGRHKACPYRTMRENLLASSLLGKNEHGRLQEGGVVGARNYRGTAGELQGGLRGLGG